MSNNQTNPYLNGMGGMNAMGINPAQLTPALYQQIMQNQQAQSQNLVNNQQQQFNQMVNNGGGNGNGNNNGGGGGGGMNGNNGSGFSGIHQTYQRLQSQESAKLDQQRLGVGFPGTAAPGQYQQLLALQSQSNISPNTNNNPLMGAMYPNQHQQQHQTPQPQQQQLQPQQQQHQQQQTPASNQGMIGGQNMNFSYAQLQSFLQQHQQQQQQQQPMQQQQQQQQGGQGGMGQGTNALGMGGMGMGMNIHSQNQGLNLQGLSGDSEQGRRQQALQSMLQGQNLSAQQQQNIFAGAQPTPQFNPSPIPQNTQMSLPQNDFGGGMSLPPGLTPQQLEQFFRANPGMDKDPAARNQAIQQILTKFRQNVGNNGNNGNNNVNMGGNGPSPGQGQNQQRQQPHPVGLNGFPGQQGQNQMGQQQQQPQQQQQQRPMPNQPNQQMPPQQQQAPQQQQQRMTSEQQYNLAGQQFQNANMGNDAQRQIEALQAMKQRQRSGLVTPQMPNANSLPLTSPQPMGQSMQQQQQGPSQGFNNQNLTPSHHHRTLSQSSNVQPPIPQPMPPQQQQQQQQGAMQSKEGNGNPVYGMTEENLLKVANTMIAKLRNSSNPQENQMARSTMLQLVTEYKRRHIAIPQPLIDGLTDAFPGHVGNLLALEYAKLQAMVFQNSTSAVKQQQQMKTQQQGMQQPQQGNRQMQMPNQNNGQMGAGSQTNPVDITTPSLPVMNSNIPQFAQQPAGANMNTIAPPPPPQRQPSSSGPGSGQTNPQQQWQQQQQQGQSNQGQGTPLPIQQSINRGRPWTGQDFSKDHFPVPEDRFMAYLSQVLNMPNLTPPIVQNKAVDLYALFGLVHRNGGSVKLEGNVPVWSQIAGLLGFGESTQSGPAARSSPNIAVQIAQVHAKYLTKLEDIFYKNQFEERIKAIQAQQGQNNGAPVLPPNAQQQSQQQQQPPQISNQFLEAVGRAPNTLNMLNDQQRRALEGRKAAGQTSVTPTQQQQQLQPQQQQQQQQQQQTGQTRQPQTDIGLLQAMRQNPKMAVFWVKSREGQMIERLRDPTKGPRYGQVSAEVKAKFLTEMAGLPQVAADAQSKMPRFFMVAVERSTNPAFASNTTAADDCGMLLSLIHWYTLIQGMMNHASQDRFLLDSTDLSKLKDRIMMITNRFAGYMSELYNNPDSAQSLAKLIAAVDQGPSNVGPPSLPRQSPAALEDMASKLPKGLRVEDLKPPPAKRQKGKAGQSPSVQTPDPKTPSVVAESPAPVPGSAQSKKGPAATAAGNKRKRQASSNNVPKTAKTPTAGPPPPSMMAMTTTSKPAGTNAPADEQNESKAFFDARASLENGTSDPFEALAAALKEFEAAQIDIGQASGVSNAQVASMGQSAYGLFPPNSTDGTAGKDNRRTPTDDELFNEFLDFNGDPFPVPELMVDVTDDYSPESIRTVGRSDSLIQPVSGTSASWSFGPEGKTPSAVKDEPAHPVGMDVDDPSSNNIDNMIEIPQSPASRHYNGPLYFQ